MSGKLYIALAALFFAAAFAQPCTAAALDEFIRYELENSVLVGLGTAALVAFVLLNDPAAR